MSRIILTTVGTSLKGNADRSGRPPADLLRESPRAACAEVNVLDRILEPGDGVELFHSQTPDGESCAVAIRDYLRGRGVPAELFAVDGQTYRAADLHRGLRSLVRCLVKRLLAARHEGREPVLNALGGFKSVVMYATLVGALFGIPNVYIHEGSDELLTIPPLPVGWDVVQIDAYADTFQWLIDDLRPYAEAHSRLQAIPADLRDAMTETDTDGYVFLSPLGEAFFESYRERVETATGSVYFSAAAARAYAGSDPSTRGCFDQVLRRLRVPEIRRAGSRTLERERGDVQVFPRGRVDKRVFWYENDGGVYVLEITRHGREYEQLYARGVRKSAYPIPEMRPWDRYS